MAIDFVADLINHIATPFGNVSETKIPEDIPPILADFYRRSNGGMTNNGYFHFFGLGGPDWHDAVRWNSPEVWKSCYDVDLSPYFFFAEDAFGNQFGFDKRLKNETSFMFWVDDARLEHFADSFDDFLGFTVDTKHTFNEMRELYEAFGEVRSERRFSHLSYRKPLVFGGRSDDLANIELCDPLVNLTLLGQLTAQCRGLKPGTTINEIRIENEPRGADHAGSERKEGFLQTLIDGIKGYGLR